MKAIICETFSYFGKPVSLSLSFLMKTQRQKYRQYQCPLRKVNPSKWLIETTRSYIYNFYNNSMYTHNTNYHWELSSEISTVTLWLLRQIDLHNTVCEGKGIRWEVWTGPEVSRRFRLPDFKTIDTWRWQACQPYAPAAFTPRKYSWYSFLL
jgi:hypothetical protein